MSERVTINELARDPALVATVPLDAVPDLLADVARVQGLLLARLMTPPKGNGSAPPSTSGESERFLTANETAAMFGVRRRWLYRHAAAMGAHRLSRKVL